MQHAAATSVLVDLLVGQEFLLLILPMKDRVKDRRLQRSVCQSLIQAPLCIGPHVHFGPVVQRAAKTQV